MIPQFVILVLTIAEAVLECAPAIIRALAEGIISAIPELLPVVLQVITELVAALLELLPQLVEAGMQIIASLIIGIAQALPTLIPQMVEVVVQMVQTLIDNLPLLLDAALQLIEGLAQGILDAIPVLIEALPEVIMGIVNFLLESMGNRYNVREVREHHFIKRFKLYFFIVSSLLSRYVKLVTSCFLMTLGVLRRLSTIPPQHGTRKNKPHFQKFLSVLNHNTQSEKTTSILKFFVVLPKCHFCMPAPCSAASPCSYHRKVISHSDGYSVFKEHRRKYPLTHLELRHNLHPLFLEKFSIIFCYLELNLQIAPTLWKRKTPNVFATIRVGGIIFKLVKHD